MKERIQNIKTLFGSPKKVISILSVIAMVLSVFITPLMDLPAGRSPGTGKVYAAAENLTGTAYAVFNSGTGELDFIRSTESHKNGDTGTVKSISGGSYTGTIYTGFEENKKSYTYNSSYSSTYDTNPVLWEDIQTKVLKVNFVDDISPCTIANWFSNMNNCKVIDLAKLITSNVVDMSYLFYNCTNLSSLNLSNFDTSNVTDMSTMFYGCENLEVLDLRNFDTSNVTDMISMFINCKSVRTLDLSNFDTSNVTKMTSMFEGCENLVSLNVDKFDTSKVTSMASMFCNCKNLRSLNVNSFDTSNVSLMEGMFKNCTSLNALDLNNFDTSAVCSGLFGNTNEMFSGDSALSKITLGNKFTVHLGYSFLSQQNCFPTPIATFSGGSSSGTWGLGSETAAKVYTATELDTLGKTAGALAGTWYAQAAGTYTIKFDPNGGSGTMANETMAIGGTQNITANAFTRTGYMFKSWNTKQDGSGTSYSDKASVKGLGAKGSTVTLYAQWEPKTYKNTISHWLWEFKNQEGNNGTAKTAYRIGQTFFEGIFGQGTTFDATKGITLPNGVELKNFSYNDPTTGKLVIGTLPGTVTQPDKAMTYEYDYHPIAYKLTYNLLGGSNDSANPSSYNVLYGVTLKDAKRTGYTFSGWTDSSGKKVTGINEGANATFSSPDDLYSKLAARLTGDITLNANWTVNDYKVKFNANGGSGTMADEGMTYDTAKALTANSFKKTGYTFTGWNTKADGSGTTYEDKASVKNLVSEKGGTVTLYAQWKANTYHVKYNANGGSGTMADQSVQYDSNFVTTKNSFTKTGYKFNGWNEKADGTGTAWKLTGAGIYENGDGAHPWKWTYDKDVTLYSQWTPNTYTVKFDPNRGTGTMANESMTYDTAKALTANSFKKTGYTFTGWNTKADGSGTTYSDKASVKNLVSEKGGTVTLYAQWKANTGTVTYNANGGSIGTSTTSGFTVTNDGTVLLNGKVLHNVNGSLAYDHDFDLNNANNNTYLNIVRKGYHAKPNSEWNTKPDGTGTSFDQGATYKTQKLIPELATKDGVSTTVYVNWAPNTYHVKYNANGGSGTMTDQSVQYDSNFVTTKNAFTKQGYKFNGWNEKADGTGTAWKLTGAGIYENGDGAHPWKWIYDKDVTLYAQWMPNTYTVKFDPNRGTGTMANETMTYDAAKALTANSFTNKDYDFIGWNTKADGSGAFYTDKASVKNLASSGTVTLYAQWNYNPHVFLPKSGGKGIITLTLISAFCILAYAEREILKKRKEVR